jgi:hypothetical protein
MKMQVDNNNNQFAFLVSVCINLKERNPYICISIKPLFMFHYMTRSEYLKGIEDALAEKHKRVTASREAAAEFIDSLGIRHLLVPMTEEEIKAAEEKRTAENRTVE